MTKRFYNFYTWAWHKVLRVPIRLYKAYDNNKKSARLTVVFLHGISADSGTWRTTLRQISKDPDLQNLRLVAFDLLGFGKSLKADWLKYDEAEYNKILNNTLSHLHAKGELILIGHSMGCLIAANYVSNYESALPIAGLILVSPPVLMAGELAKLPDKVYTKSYASLHKIATDVPAAEVVAKIAQKFTSFRSDYMKSKGFARSMDEIILNRHNYQTFTNLHVPTLIIHGHFDPLVMGQNLRRVAKHNPRYVRYVSVIGQHDISVGKRAKIIAELKKYLKESNHETV